MSLLENTHLFFSAGREKQSSEVMTKFFLFHVLKNYMAIRNILSMGRIYFFQILCSTFIFFERNIKCLLFR